MIFRTIRFRDLKSQAAPRILSAVALAMLMTACGGDDGAKPPLDVSLDEPGDETGDVWSEFGIRLDDLELNGEVDGGTGFKGFAYRMDQWCYGRVPEAKILFVSEDGRRGFTLTADERGEYLLPARPGRYRLYGAAEGYENFATCNGYVICQAGQWQQANVPFVAEGPVCGESGTYGGIRGYDPDAWPDRAPTARIEAEPEVVAVGDPVTVTVSGEDDNHVVWLSWNGILGCQPDGGRAHVAACDGGPRCSGTWEVRFDAPGRYVLLAHARDDVYPNGEPHTAWSGPGAGCVEIVVTED